MLPGKNAVSYRNLVSLLVHHLTFSFLSIFFLRKNSVSVGDSFGDGLFNSRIKKSTLVNI